MHCRDWSSDVCSSDLEQREQDDQRGDDYHAFTATTEIYTLSLHDTLPISLLASRAEKMLLLLHHSRKLFLYNQCLQLFFERVN